jgi:hypothetical protein
LVMFFCQLINWQNQMLKVNPYCFGENNYFQGIKSNVDEYGSVDYQPVYNF